MVIQGCTTIDFGNLPAPDWPKLTVVEHYSTRESGNLARQYCDAPLFISVLACMQPDFDNKLCNLYFPDWDRASVADWVYRHELEHCKGYDHPGDNELHDLWERWKERRN